MTTSIEQVAERLDRGDKRFAAIEKKLACLQERTEGLPDMRKDVAATRELVEALSAVKTVARFIKWSASLVAAVAALWAIVRASAKGWF